MAANDPAFLVSKAEERYSDRLDEIAERIFSDREKRIVMLAGPSASGKTTTAGLIASRLESRGAKAFTVSLDDFYHDQRDAILDENGKPDYETVNALDIALIDSCLEDIIKNGTTRLPHFDFVSGRRSGFSDPITLGKDDVLIVEGIHALNPVITDSLPSENLMKLYVRSRPVSPMRTGMCSCRSAICALSAASFGIITTARAVSSGHMTSGGAFSAARISIFSLTATWRRRR